MPATLLQRFGSKRGLLLALARHGADTLPRQLAAVHHASAPIAALVEVFAGLADGVRSRKEFANHLAFLRRQSATAWVSRYSVTASRMTALAVRC